MRVKGILGEDKVLGKFERRKGDVNLDNIRIEGEILDGKKVGIEGKEIKKIEINVVEKDRVKIIEGLKKGLKIKVINGFENEDEIENSEEEGGMEGMLIDDGVLRVGEIMIKNEIKKDWRRSGVGRWREKEIEKMGGKGDVKGRRGILWKDEVKLRELRGKKDEVGGGVGKIENLERKVKENGKEKRILDKKIEERRRKRKKIEDIERIEGMEEIENGSKNIKRKIDVGMGEIEKGKREDERN